MAAAAPDSPPYQAGWTCLCGNHATVTVQPRTWAGINKQGGVGTIVKYHLADDTFDIKLILRGRDNRVARNYLSCYDLTSTPGQRTRPKREFYDPRALSVKRAKTRADATASDEYQEPDEPSVLPAGGPQRRHASLASAPRVVPPPPPAVSIAPCHGHPQQDAADDAEAGSGMGGPTRPRARQLRRSEISTNVADHSSTAASSMTFPMPDRRSGSRRVASRPSTASCPSGAEGVESDDLVRGAGVGSSDLVQGSRRTIRSGTTDSSTTSAMNSIIAPSTTATTSASSGVTAGGCSTTSSSPHHSRSKPPPRTTRDASTSHHMAAADSRTVDTITIASTTDPATAVSSDTLGPVGGFGNPSSRMGRAAPSQSSSFVREVAAVVIGPSSNHADVSGSSTSKAISEIVGAVVPRSQGGNTTSRTAPDGHGDVKSITRAAGTAMACATAGQSSNSNAAAIVSRTSRTHVATSGPKARVPTRGSNSTTTTSRPSVRSRANTVTSSSSSTSRCSDIRTLGSAVSGGSTGTKIVGTPADLVPAGSPAPVVRTQSSAPALLREKTHTNTHPAPASTIAEPIGCENFGAGQSVDGVDKPQKTAALPSSRTAQVPRKPMAIPGPNTTEMNGISCDDDDDGRLLELSSLDLPSPPPRRSRSSTSSIVNDDGGSGRFYEFTSMLSELMGEDKVKETHLRQVASSRGFAEREVTGFLRRTDDAGRVLIAGGYIYHC